MRNAIRDRAGKPIDDALRVHVWTPTGFLSAGLMLLDEDGEQMSASFRYDDTFVQDPRAFPIDPLNMALRQTAYASTSAHVRLGAIFDAAPDAWGRKVVTAQLPEDARQRVFRGSFLRGADGIGAIVLTPAVLTNELDLNRIVGLSLAERPGLSQIAQAAAAASQFEGGEDLTAEMRLMLGGSWTIGGARPKAILRDDLPGALTAASMIAKFQSRHDTLARNRLEFASLRMAADIGLPVPGHELIELGQGQTALLLQRFDRECVNGQVHRRHYLSAMSLASYQPQSKFLDSAMDRATLSWSRLLDLASRISDHPGASRVEMFARLCLNAALQNTDDHLKNFGFLKSHDSATRYEVAPVFDVSPQAGSRHYLHCSDLGQVYSLSEAVTKGPKLGIARAACQEVEARIVSVVTRRLEYLDAAGMSQKDVARAEAWIDAGMGARYRQKQMLRPVPEEASDTPDSAPDIPQG